MSSRIVAERYARALLQAAEAQDLVDQVESDLIVLQQALAAEPAFTQLFYHHQLIAARKRELLLPVLIELLQQPLSRNFVQLLWQKKREAELPGIVAAYQASLRQLRGQLVAQVTSVRQLDEAELAQVSEQVKQLTGSQAVELESKIDPSIMGGVVLQIGDKLYDGSLARRLQQLRQKMLQAQVNQSGVSS